MGTRQLDGGLTSTYAVFLLCLPNGRGLCGHVVGDASGVTRYVAHDGGLLRCFAVHRGTLDERVRARLPEICDSIAIR